MGGLGVVLTPFSLSQTKGSEIDPDPNQNKSAR